MRILKLTEDTRKDILQNLLKRSPNNYGCLLYTSDAADEL